MGKQLQKFKVGQQIQREYECPSVRPISNMRMRETDRRGQQQVWVWTAPARHTALVSSSQGDYSGIVSSLPLPWEFFLTVVVVCASEMATKLKDEG